MESEETNSNQSMKQNQMKRKVALITGITGQDGSYLAELLLNKGYIVHGIKRRSSSFNTERIDHLYREPVSPFVSHSPPVTSDGVPQQPSLHDSRFILHYGDLSDASNLIGILQKVQPDEVYNLAAQSHVKVSFETPEYTANSDGVGTLRLLEAIRILGLGNSTRFYQASTSELFGRVSEVPQSERTPFYPRSPYAAAKLYAYWITINYREAYGLFAANGILFNHESPRRGETFVTRKITRGIARILAGQMKCLYLGNLDAQRDWGHARDYVEGMWRILQHSQPEDFVLATGQTCTIRDFCQKAFAFAGILLEWKGSGCDEVGVNTADGQIMVAVDRSYFRPTEVDLLCGDATKAKEKLGWTPACQLDALIKEMVEHDCRQYGVNTLIDMA